MKTLIELNNAIEEEKKHMNDAYVQARGYQESMERLERERKVLIKEQEEKTLNLVIDEFLNINFGIKNQVAARAGKYVVFDKECNIIKTVTCGNTEETDFKYISGEGDSLENWLRDNKLYAHSCSSFLGRSLGWYNMTFKEQLKNLMWEFNTSGELKKTQW